VVFAAFTAACSDGRPPTNTELGRIVRIDKHSDAAAQLQRFAEARLSDPIALRRELADAGFKRSVFVDDEDGRNCEHFDLKTKDIFPSVYFVNICGGKVFANAGQIAP
jgi:hypothetical protein